MRQFTTVVACAAIIGLLSVACGGDADGDWQGSVTDSAGVEIVTNEGTGQWGPGDGWTVSEDLRIGTAEGEADYQFGTIVGIDVGSDGRIYVMDQQASEVRVFSPEGEFITRIGQAGSGPGELSQSAGPVFVTPGDTVIVPDVGQQRVTRYTADGELAGSYPMPMSEGIPARWMQAPNADLIQQAMIMALPNQPDVEPKNFLLRRNPAGEVTDTIMEMPAGETMDFSSGQPRMTIFAPEPMWAIGPDGRLFFGINSQYRFQVFDEDGELSRIVQKDTERQPITSGDEEEFRRLIQEAWQQAGMPPEAVSMMAQAINFAEYYPAYANLLGGPEGTIWAQGVQTPEMVQEQGITFNLQDMGGNAWEVFSDEGRFLGVVEMPPRFTPLSFDGDVIYGVFLDDLDVQYATRLQLNRPEPVIG